MIVDTPLHKGLLVEGMVDVVYQECQIVLQHSHQSESAFLEDLVVLDPLLLFEDELGKELLLVFLEVFNLQKQVGDDLDRIHVGITHFILMLMMLILLFSGIGLSMFLVYGVLDGFVQTLFHAITSVDGFYLKLFLVQGLVS